MLSLLAPHTVGSKPLKVGAVQQELETADSQP
jgi:hypothetical protein